MSSRTRSTGLSASETPTKKKFGKNLNKLAKPPAPPIPTAGRSASGSSRNGLLLLSTKRSSSTSGLLASKSAAAAKDTAARPLGVTTESYTSAHDALLGAVIGASRTADPQQPPDAWGVAATETKHENETLLAPNGKLPSHHHAAAEGEATHHVDADASPRVTREEDGDMNAPETTLAGGHGNDQGVYMSKLARERAEARRQEEDARMNDQRERAAQRLRELEKKMAEKPAPAPAPVSVVMRPPSNSVIADAGSSTPVVLEPLRRGVAELSGDEKLRSGQTSSSLDHGSTTRTLFDPNRPYSSLVGGGTAEQDPSSPQPTASQGTDIAPSPKVELAEDTREEEPTTYQMVNLTSRRYEDRDRGERSSNAGPKMLFDPKSGSMVAVTASKEKGPSRSQKGKPKGRSARGDPRGSETVNKESIDVAAFKLKKGKGRKDDTQTPRSRRATSSDGSVKAESKSCKGRNGKKRSESRLPRTCGVLFTRDKSGNICCADSCDGDQGYGCHSVPGGRVKNPNAYMELLKQQQAYDGSVDYRYNIQQQYMADQMTSKSSETNGASVNQTAVDWVKPNEKIELVTGAMESPTLQATASPWAPSEAALRAAMAAEEELAKGHGKDESLDDESESDPDEDLPSFIGLGFDPTENMDAVMRSPSAPGPTIHLESPVLAALALDAPETRESTSRNLFALGSSSTWGQARLGAEDVTSWSMLGPASDETNENGKNNKSVTASFLSLSSSNTWGTGGLTGLGGPALSHAHAGDHGAGAAGD